MKLAGLTWWRNNYGSILQAYALQEMLNQFDDVDYEIICQYGKKIASADNLLDKLKSIGIKKTLMRVFWKFGLPQLRKRNLRIQSFVDCNLKVSEQSYSEATITEANKKYDGFTCGSDQIWNPELVSIDSMYWLGFVEPGKKKIAYAPSFGVNSVTEEQKQAIRKKLSTFDAISCREESGTKTLNQILGEERCQTVLDPTMLVSRNVWDSICAPCRYGEPYIFVYMLRGTRQQRRLIETLAKQRGLKIVTMPFLDTEKIELYDFKFGDIKLWDADPADFISVIRNAEYIFTDSFHCMVFSCLYHVEFFVFPKIGKAQMSRIIGLQKLLEISDRMIDTDFSCEQLAAAERINWSRVDAILSEKRQESYHYLREALKIEH